MLSYLFWIGVGIFVVLSAVYLALFSNPKYKTGSAVRRVRIASVIFGATTLVLAVGVIVETIRG